MTNPEHSADRETNQSHSKTARPNSVSRGRQVEDSSTHIEGVGGRHEHSGRKELFEADPPARDQAVLNLVAHWRLAGSHFGTALARDIRLFCGLERAGADTLDRLKARIASGALLTP